MSARKTPGASKRRILKKTTGLPAPYTDHEIWESFYALTGHWLSDIQFFSDELTFFRRLILDHFGELIDLPHIDRTRTLLASLLRLEKRCAMLDQNVVDHQSLLAKALKSPIFHEGSICKDQHAAIEGDLALFAKDFRLLKKDLFAITEEILRTEKARRLLFGKSEHHG